MIKISKILTIKVNFWTIVIGLVLYVGGFVYIYFWNAMYLAQKVDH